MNKILKLQEGDYMTRLRDDEHSTEFGLWLRGQEPYPPRPELDSRIKHFITTNIDYLWKNYKTNKWMLIEEKRYMAKVEFPQSTLFKYIDSVCKKDNNYCGFHVIQFENTNPEDGKIYLDGSLITKDQLIEFLQFKSLTL
jgi:hypothetical protein